MNLKSTLLAVFTLITFQLSYADYDTFTVNVPNAQGGYTALVIKISGQGYTGPQGEYYSSFPSVAQLQTVYGLNIPSATPAAPAPVPAPISYTVAQPQVQWVENTPVEEDEEYPVDTANITEISAPPPSVVEYNEWAIFKPRKKEKHEDKNKHTDKPPDKQHDKKAADNKSNPENKHGNGN